MRRCEKKNAFVGDENSQSPTYAIGFPFSHQSCLYQPADCLERDIKWAYLANCKRTQPPGDDLGQSATHEQNVKEQKRDGGGERGSFFDG